MTEILGKTIGDYQVMEFIARGDSSFVYKAFQPAMNRFVAIKILPPSLARDESAVRQFQRQGDLMAQLEHPHILPVYDYGQAEGVSYIAARFVEGGTLKDRLPQTFPVNQTLRLMREITEALTYLHERGFVHGNLKPSNILIDEDGNALLADPGLGQGSSQTAGNAYMSPEQEVDAEPDGRADIYALGALLYHIVVGEAPPVGVVPNPRGKRPELSVEVEKVILKAMAQYPDQRFHTPAEFMRALESALAAQTLPARPVTTPAPKVTPLAAKPSTEPKVYPAPKLEDKREYSWLIFALGGLAAVVLLCGLGIFLIFFNRAGDESAEVPTPPPGVPRVTAVADVNVRSGPDVAYEVIGVLRQGQTAEAVGVSADGRWWAINFPASPTGNGWASAEFVIPENTENLPILQGPPPPTPILPTAPPPTPEPGDPRVTAAADVNVHSGPDFAYQVIGVLRQGQTAVPVGVSVNGQWYAIQFPGSPTGNGWLPVTTVIAENTENLPILQGPPPPTPLPPTPEPPTPIPSETPLPTEPPPEPTQPPPEPTEPPPEPTQPPPEPTLPPLEPTLQPPEPTLPPAATLPQPIPSPEQPISPTVASDTVQPPPTFPAAEPFAAAPADSESGGGGPGGSSICGSAVLAMVGFVAVAGRNRTRRKKRAPA